MKLKDRFMLFFEEPAEPADGSGGVVDLLDEPAPASGVEEPVVEPVEPVAPVVPTFTPESIAAAVAAGFKQAGITGQQQQVQQRQLTREEAEKQINLWQPTKEWLARYDNLETREAAIKEQRDGMLSTMITVMQMRDKETEKQLQQYTAPMQQYVANQEAAARETRFNKSYEVLSKPEFVPIRDAVIKGLADQGHLTNKSEADAFKLIATTCESILKQGNPNFKLSPAGSTPAGAKPNSNALRASSTGSGGGGGGGGAATTTSKSKVVALLDAK